MDRLIVDKATRRLSLFHDRNRIKTYRIALGQNPLSATQEEDDMKKLEGIYKIDGRNPQSNFHLALHIAFTDEEIGELWRVMPDGTTIDIRL